MHQSNMNLNSDFKRLKKQEMLILKSVQPSSWAKTSLIRCLKELGGGSYRHIGSWINNRGLRVLKGKKKTEGTIPSTLLEHGQTNK